MIQQPRFGLGKKLNQEVDVAVRPHCLRGGSGECQGRFTHATGMHGLGNTPWQGALRAGGHLAE
jgi:hypothetical protein